MKVSPKCVGLQQIVKALYEPEIINKWEEVEMVIIGWILGTKYESSINTPKLNFVFLNKDFSNVPREKTNNGKISMLKHFTLKKACHVTHFSQRSAFFILR